MVSTTFFLSFTIFIILKSSLCLRMRVYINFFILFLCLLVFLVLFLIKSSTINHSNVSGDLVYSISYSVLFSLLFVCFLSRRPLLFLITLELCVFPILYVIFNYSKDQDKISSSLFIFFINIIGSIPFMLFCILLRGSFYWVWIPDMVLFCSRPFIFLCIVLILFCKLPLFLLHFWLTKAHVSASGPSSILLASLILKLGRVGLLKFSVLQILYSFFFLGLLTCFSLVSCTLILLMIITSFDLKYLVACSSILHMARTPFLSLSCSSEGVIRVLIIRVGHGVTSLVLFFILTVLYEARTSRSSDVVKSQESPTSFFTKWIFTFAFLNLGIPPFLNFIRECYSTSFVLCLGSLILVFCLFFFMVFRIFFTLMLILKISLGGKSISFDLMDLSNIGSYLKFLVLFIVLRPILINQ